LGFDRNPKTEEKTHMKIGMVSDSLGNLGFEAMLDAAAAAGIQGLEVNTGNWSAAPHLDLGKLLSNESERRRFLRAFTDRRLELIALNANGNQLHPTDGERQSKVIHDTVRLAGLLGVTKVSMMSGLPGGAPGDSMPNWIVSSWPPETQSILKWQWEEKLLPYWRQLANAARANGVQQLCIELHGNQLVYNVPSLLKLRQEIGDIVGANLDPSHLMWMDADPIAAVDALGDAIYHVHAKDTFVNPAICGITSRLENGPMAQTSARSWSYITLGYGHDERWWRGFCYRLRMNGYDGWLSIEHEDVVLSRIEGVRRSVELLQRVAPVEVSDYLP
jgi:sugar phosphate isomerase/epimerase